MYPGVHKLSGTNGVQERSLSNPILNQLPNIFSVCLVFGWANDAKWRQRQHLEVAKERSLSLGLETWVVPKRVPKAGWDSWFQNLMPRWDFPHCRPIRQSAGQPCSACPSTIGHVCRILFLLTGLYLTFAKPLSYGWGLHDRSCFCMLLLLSSLLLFCQNKAGDAKDLSQEHLLSHAGPAATPTSKYCCWSSDRP